MKTNIKWLSIGIAILVISIIIMVVFRKDEEVILTDAMKIMTMQDSYISTSGEIRAAAYYGGMNMTSYEKKGLLKKLAKGLGITEYSFEASWDMGRDTICIKKDGEYAATLISLVTIEDENACAQYIMYELNIEDSPESVCHYADIIRNELRNLGLDDDVTVTLVSNYEGTFDIDAKNKLADEVLKCFESDIVTENRTDELFSIYAYVEGMSQGIKVGDKEINFNIAINHNEETNQTRVYLAAPIIEMEY
ncbi:MAG: YwmB family TATA-box binding protein [Lachnospiraceae bacterium]|nr:YwmB family TATA-box binding protein [Lachnospiraceae bacterium]